MTQETAVFLFPALKEPTKIGVIECDVLVEQEITLSSEVAEHPVEDGFPVHDHVIRKPVKLAMTIAVSNMPVTWYDYFGGSSPERISDSISKLEEIYKNGYPITIATSEKLYENMVMTDCRIPKNRENGKILKVPLEFTQIRKVQVKTAEIPTEQVDSSTKGKAGETEKDAGAAETKDVGTGDKSGRNTSGSYNSSSSNSDASGAGTAEKSKSVLKGILG